MNSKVAIIILFVVAAAGIFYVTSRGPASAPGPDGARPSAGAATEITMLYSTEKQAWIEAAAQNFQKEHPDIRITLTGKGSFDAAQAILDGKEKPTVWSPADSLGLSMLAADWQTKTGAPLFAQGGDDQPQSLVITPLVFVIWEDRAQALLKSTGGKLSWKLIHKAVTSNQGWLAIGGKGDWGFVKLGHTDPTRSNSGLQALLLMTFDYYGKTSGLTVSDLLDPDYQEWLKGTERGVGKFEPSTGTFMVDMIRFGPSKYDLALVYESLAIAQIENAQGRWGSLRVYYPQVTQWSDHPAALLQADHVRDVQKRAARLWLAYLRSRPVQERALSFGFRPADTSVPLKNADPQNPFVRLTPYGIRLEIPQVAQQPDVAVVRNLMTLWSRTIGNR